ncbi:hypothetical protein LCGC14_0960330 [marine sediment metagenome]|uniref:NTP pyrophosphohydrolase MazG putative catalytic core domain-containing protein n=1 Tax=marine sediment metagenome TaxID=412755 RepID=A0A0F9NEM4_9ZZZZ
MSIDNPTDEELAETRAEIAAEVAEIFIVSFNRQSEKVHQNAVNKGFWDKPRNDGELIALIHSELSEALQALRNGNPASSNISCASPGFINCVSEELADTIIRIMDMADSRGWRVAEAIIAKMKYNESRPHKHGKEF